jgi:hypothetical protein
MNKSPAERIIDKFGGVSAMARLLKHRHVTTVQGWKTRKIIPAGRMDELLDLAAANNIELTADDFVRPRAARAA